jgi:hypothetical protein
VRDETSPKVYARLKVIPTKLPVMMDLIEIFTHTSIDELERYEDGSRETREG